MPQSTDSAQEVDINGYITIERNPISRMGVFQYLGRSISSGLEPDRVYNVYRPAEELSDPEAIASFRMVPLINDHVMLGEQFTPAEEKGVEGVTGEDVVFENGILYAPLKIFSETLKRLIASGKKALSLGYRVGEWEQSSGVFNGQPYEFIQRKIRGNHIALVDEARMGRDIAVLDGFAFDNFDLVVEDATTMSEKQAAPTGDSDNGAAENLEGANDMDPKDKEAKDAKDAEEKLKMEADAKDAEEKEKKEAEDKVAKDKADMEEKEAKDAEEKEKKEEKGAMDAAIKGLTAKVETLEKTTIKTLMGEINSRNKVASEAAAVVGTFDHAEMTTNEVIKYALDKVGVKVTAGQEQAAWDGFLAGSKSSGGNVSFSLDAKAIKSDSLVAATLRDSQ